MSEKECSWVDCERIAATFYITPEGLKFWYCTYHYDVMAKGYRKDSTTDPSALAMVKLNGW